MEQIKTSLIVAGKEISIESGKLAKQANGACVVRVGDTMVLVTAVASSTPKEGTDFMPLTVDYKERAYSTGRFPGGFRPGTGRRRTAGTDDRQEGGSDA